MLINPLIMLTILSLFLLFLFGETPRFQQLLTVAANVENQQTLFFLLTEACMLRRSYCRRITNGQLVDSRSEGLIYIVINSDF